MDREDFRKVLPFSAMTRSYKVRPGLALFTLESNIYSLTGITVPGSNMVERLGGC